MMKRTIFLFSLLGLVMASCQKEQAVNEETSAIYVQSRFDKNTLVLLEQRNAEDKAAGLEKTQPITYGKNDCYIQQRDGTYAQGDICLVGSTGCVQGTSCVKR